MKKIKEITIIIKKKKQENAFLISFHLRCRLTFALQRLCGRNGKNIDSLHLQPVKVFRNVIFVAHIIITKHDSVFVVDQR